MAIDDGDAANEELPVTVGLWAIVWVNDATLVLVLDTMAELVTVILPDTEGEDVWDCDGVLDSLFCAELLTLDDCVISEVSDDLIEGLVIELAEILYTLLTVGVASGVLDSVVIGLCELNAEGLAEIVCVTEIVVDAEFEDESDGANVADADTVI